MARKWRIRPFPSVGWSCRSIMSERVALLEVGGCQLRVESGVEGRLSGIHIEWLVLAANTNSRPGLPADLRLDRLIGQQRL